jgi:hypothetical protein
MQDPIFFDGAIVFLDEILNATKQSYFEYFEDFKRISNYLVSSEVMGRFYECLCKLEEPIFCNASRFLEILFTRMNSENEDSRYYQKEEETESTMTFEIDVFLKNIPQLMGLTTKMQNFVLLS